jgi:hypothetical protein
MAFDPDAYLSGSPSSSFNPDAYLDEPEEEGGLDYVTNLLKQGFSRTLGSASQAGKVNPFTAIPTAIGNYLMGDEVLPTQGEQQEKEAESLAALGGRATPRSRDIGTNILEEGIRSVGDPLAYLAAPAKLAGLAVRAGGNFLTGMFAETGGELGAQTQKALTGEEGQVGRLLGSLAGGATAIPRAGQTSTVSQGIGGTLKLARDARANPDEFVEAMASGGAKKFLETIAREEGIEDLPAYLRDINKSSSKITGKDVPLLVSMPDNPAVKAMVTELVQSNPDFRAKATQTVEGVRGKVEGRADTLFGQRGQALPEGESVQVRPESIQKRIASIDEKLASNLDPIYPRSTREDIGSNIERLVDQKKSLVKAEIAPQYKALEEEARASSVAVSPAASQQLFDFIQENNYRDIFGKGTPLDKRITKVVGDGQGLSFDDLNSLKKEINRLQSKSSFGQDTHRKLGQLEDVVNEVRKELPGEFNQRLLDLDKQYYEKMGLPFGENALKDITAKKYDEIVAPVITNHGSSLRQFIAAVGPEVGVPIARDAILSDMFYKSTIMKDGELNQNGLSQYLKQKQDVISQIPGLGKELLDIKSADKLLKDRKITLDMQAAEAQKEIANTFFAKLGGTPPNWKQLASDVMNNRQAFNKILGPKGDLTKVAPEVRGAVVNSLRREILDIAGNSSSGSVAYLTDPNNAFVIQSIFGKGYKEKALEVAKLLDKVDKADVSKIGIKIKEGSLDPIGSIVEGADAPYLLSQFRDRISSVPQKLARVYSRVKGADIKKKRNEQIMSLLLDPNSTEMLARVSKAIGPSIDSPIKAKRIMDAMASVLPSSLIIGAQVGQSGLREEEQAPEIPQGYFE